MARPLAKSQLWICRARSLPRSAAQLSTFLWSEPLQLDHRESDLSRLLDQLGFELVWGLVAQRRM